MSAVRLASETRRGGLPRANSAQVARREGRFWLVDLEGVGRTQGRNLQDAMSAELIVTMTGRPVDVNFVVELLSPLTRGPGGARQGRRRAGGKKAVRNERLSKAS